MKQLHFTGIGKPALLDVDEPACGADQILLKTRVSALSNGTERAVMMGLTYNKGGRFPSTPGYQAISEVVETGDEVTRFQVGDLVYTGTFGTHAEYHTAKEADLVVAVPADGDLEALAFLAVAAVSTQDLELTGVTAGERLLVIGAGPIGQFAAQVGAIRGAEVVMASRGEQRLAAAREAGVERTIVAASTEDETLREAGPFDVVAECSGADNLDGILGTGFASPKLLIPKGGRLVLVAGRGEVRYDSNAAQGGRVTIYHCTHFQQPHLEQVLAWFLDGRLQSRPFIRDVIPAADIVSVYETLRDTPSALFGTLFRWD